MDSIAHRFWSWVDKSGDCWLWGGSKNHLGYGLTKFNRKTTSTHRAAWMLTNGDIPSGLNVLHRCDNPPCVRPDHLFLGTRSDNMQDMIRKGRANPPRGRRSPHAVLSPADVIEIRASRAKGVVLAHKYGVSQGLISFVRNRKRWQHVL